MISEQVLQQAPELQREYRHARPFPHMMVENFLRDDVCDSLLQDFPAFDDKHAVNEHGTIGGKAVVERVSRISDAYRGFYDYINSAAFLDAMSALTGIPELIADPTLFGGGTHDNRDGQGLNVHVDFNIDERRMLHRRINLLIYLNREWEASWGGAIELHSDPHNPAVDNVKAFLPLFNHAVIFDTSEFSWHGFPRIALPPDKRHLSRKSFSIYLYTKERPAEEIVAPHTTFYLGQPLPAQVKAGHTLTQSDVDEISSRLLERDGLLQMYQKLLIQKEQRMQDFMHRNQGEMFNARILSSRSWKLLMALQRIRFRVRHILSK
jgi:2OG-Fe(II) oxygenase superfamily